MRLLCCQFRKPSLAMGHLHTPWVTQRGSGVGLVYCKGMFDHSAYVA